MSETDTHVAFVAPELEEVARLFPSYDILSLIACGGMGAVFHAVQRSLDRPAAIKILPRDFANDDAFREGFELEAKAMGKLNHPNLIGVYDFGEADGMLYIIMEFVPGRSLYETTHGCSLDQLEAIGVIVAVCNGLAHAHENGILHRDIKPSNILLDGNANPKIGDFGLARALEREIQDGEQIYGTPGYTAPEVLEPPYTFDQRADIFSVGVMLHELLTGNLPETDARPASAQSGCTPRLDAVIRKATHPDPARRYLTAGELAAELSAIGSSPGRALLTAGSAAQAKPGRALSQPRGGRIQKSSSGGGFLFFLLLLIGGAAAYYYVLKPSGYLGGAAGVPAEREIPVELPKEPEVRKIVLQKPGTPSLPELSGNPRKTNSGETAEPPVDPTIVAMPETPGAATQAILAEARTAMRQRVAPTMESYRQMVSENAKAYEKSLKMQIGGLPARARNKSEEALGERTALWTAEGYRMPDQIHPSFKQFLEDPSIYDDHLSNQIELTKRLGGKLSTEPGVYVLLLENQIERLRKSGNQAEISELEEEIKKVKNDPGYFQGTVIR